MAVVRISENLVQAVARNAGRQYDDTVSACEASKPDSSVAEKVLERILHPYIDILVLMPKEFLWEVKQVNLYVSHGSYGNKSVKVEHNLNCPMKVPVGVPGMNKGGMSYGVYNTGMTITIPVKVMPDLLSPLTEWADKLKATEDQRANAESQVRSMLSQFSTLAPALRAWPALWELLPLWAQDKHKEIVKREKRAVGAMYDESIITELTAKMATVRLTKSGE